MPSFFRTKRVFFIFTILSAFSLIALVALFYLPYLPYAVIPYVWIGWFLPFEGIILLLAMSCILIIAGAYYWLSKKEQARTLLSNLTEYWWIAMRLYLGISWIAITLFIWTREPVRHEFPAMIDYMASAGPYPWYNGFLTNLILPNAQLVANLIQYAQLLIGFCLLLGLLTDFASGLGIFLNLNFILGISWADKTGTVAAQNFFLIFHQTLFIILRVGHLFGIDKYLAKEFPQVFN